MQRLEALKGDNVAASQADPRLHSVSAGQDEGRRGSLPVPMAKICRWKRNRVGQAPAEHAPRGHRAQAPARPLGGGREGQCGRRV